MENKVTIPIASAFIKKNNRFLLARGPKFDFWRVPGGRIEPGEKAEETLTREMKEELGVDINVEHFLGYGQDTVILRKAQKVSRLILYFECSLKSGNPAPLDKEDVLHMKWLTLEEIMNISDLEPAMKHFFSEFSV